MRYKIILSYNGSGFSGWQKQPNAITIQESLQNALGTLLNEETEVTGAGRTDAGVNAVNYAAHFDCKGIAPGDCDKLIYKLNAIIADKICIHSIEEVSEDFHARFSAVSREYKYFIHRVKDPIIGSLSYHYKGNLDIGKMNAAGELLLGTRDFSCFEKIGGNNKTSICTVTSACWENYKPKHVEMMDFPYNEGDYLVFSISADRFLRNMVRAVVGTLMEIGRGKHEPAWIEQVLLSGNRSAAGESVPGNALFFCGAKY